MNDTKLANIHYLTDNLQKSIYGYLLSNHTLSIIDLFDLEIPIHHVKSILEWESDINNNAIRFNIDNGKITISKTALNDVKGFLLSEFARLIPPKNFEQKPYNFKAFMGRYFTHKSYDNNAIRLFDTLIDKLYNIEIITNPSNDIALNNFNKFVNYFPHIWRNIISDLINGKLSPKDNVTKYFNDFDLMAYYLNWIPTIKIPSLIKVSKGTFTITDAFFEDNTALLPYLIPLINCSYTPKQIINSILFSCL